MTEATDLAAAAEGPALAFGRTYVSLFANAITSG